MTLTKAVESGLAGATVISVLTETLNGVTKKSFPNIGQKNFRKKLKGIKENRSLKTEHFVQLADQLLNSTAYLGLASLGKKKNSVLRGALLGTAAGLGIVLLHPEDYTDEVLPQDQSQRLKKVLSQVAQVGLYTLGGVIAGKVSKSKGKRKR